MIRPYTASLQQQNHAQIYFSRWKKSRVRPLTSSRGDYAKYRNGYLYAEWLVTLQSPFYAMIENTLIKTSREKQKWKGCQLDSQFNKDSLHKCSLINDTYHSIHWVIHRLQQHNRIRKSIFLDEKSQVWHLMSSRGDYAKHWNGYWSGWLLLNLLSMKIPS